MKHPKLRFIEPMECLMVSKLPEGADWSYEIKLDGYRAQLLTNGRLISRISQIISMAVDGNP